MMKRQLWCEWIVTFTTPEFRMCTEEDPSHTRPRAGPLCLEAGSPLPLAGWWGGGALEAGTDRRHRTMVTLCVVILGPHYTLASRNDWFPPLVTTHLASKTVGGNVPILIYILTLTDTFPTNKWERVVKLPQRSLEIQQSSFIVQQPTDNHIF